MNNLIKAVALMIAGSLVGCEPHESSTSYEEYKERAISQLNEMIGSQKSLGEMQKSIEALRAEADVITKRMGPRQRDLSCPPFEVSARIGAVERLVVVMQDSTRLKGNAGRQALDKELQKIMKYLQGCSS